MFDETDEFFAEHDEIFNFIEYPDEIDHSTFTAETYLKDYTSRFEQTCVNHDAFAFSSFHMLLGSLPNIRNLRVQKGTSLLDPRLHVFYIAPSGSGKGAGINFITACGAASGLAFNSCGAITSNALTGTRDKKDKPKDSDSEFDKWPITDGYLNPDAMPSNISFFTEAAELVSTRPAKDMAKCLDHFQKAMNPYGTEDNRISKKTGLGPEITFFPNTTLFFTTYKPYELAEVITQRGFLQRCLFLIREVDIDQRFEDIDEVNNMMDTEPTDFTPVVSLLDSINAHYENITRLHIDRSILNIVKHHVATYKRVLLNCNRYIQERLVDFIPRFNDIYWKVAMHSCILRRSTTINEEDISYAHHFLHDKFLTTLEFLRRTIPVPYAEQKQQELEFSQVYLVYTTLKRKYKENYFSISKFQDVLVKNKFFMSKREATAYLYRLVKAGIADRKDDTISIKRKARIGETF